MYLLSETLDKKMDQLSSPETFTVRTMGDDAVRKIPRQVRGKDQDPDPSLVIEEESPE